MIYEHALLDDIQPTPLKLAAFVPLCGVSRQVHDETYHLYLRMNHFIVLGLEKDWAWFDHHMQNDTGMLQQLRKITFCFHRPFRPVRSQAKKFRYTPRIWDALMQCKKIELTLSCRLDEFLTTWNLGLLDKLPACRALTISALPESGQSCNKHKQERGGLSNPQRTRERRMLYAWRGVRGALADSLKSMYVSEDYNRLADEKSSFTLRIEHGGSDCYTCLMKGASSQAECPPCRFYQDGHMSQRFSLKELRQPCVWHGRSCH